jgi:hypothetical protein
MDVAPHPHIGLATVTWLLAGEALHKDSLGTTQPIVSGQLNWMTAGRGISHSEEGSGDGVAELHGVQLWVALPDAQRHAAPRFAHHAAVPSLAVGGASVTVFVGACAGVASPAETSSPLLGLDVTLPAGATAPLPVDPTHEHALVVVDGEVVVDGVVVRPGELAYLGRRRGELPLRAQGGGRAIVVGGEPLGEPLLLWWNFVARDHDEIVAARDAWEAGDERFGRVDSYRRGPRTPAPPLPS